MKRTIHVLAKTRPGVLAKLTTTLVRNGYWLESQHKNDDLDNGQTSFRFVLQDDKGNLPAVLELLRGHEDVIEVIDADAPVATASVASATTPVEPFEDLVRSTFKSLVAGYPATEGPIRDFEQRVAPGERRKGLYALGKNLGRYQYQTKFSQGSPLKTVQALQRTVGPALEKLVRTSIDGLSIRIYDSPYARKNDEERMSCEFLRGFVEGLLTAAPATARSVVAEIQCVGSGAPFCLLQVR